MAEVDYPAILAEAWAQHLAPREPDAPTVISLFAGCGGSSLGYSMAGFRELLAVEWDDNAVETFRLNFPGVPVYHGDIAKLSVDECLSLTGLEPGQLDVLDGSPPCQGFSTAGKRQLDDPRNGLFREYVRLLQGLRPKVFIMENVSGMVKGKMKLVFAEAMRELKGSGYKVSARLMNAMYFHVPQSRERVIFIGVREDVGKEPSHPKAENKPVTVREAWVGITSRGPQVSGQKQRIAAHMPPGANNGGGKYSRITEGRKVEFGLARVDYAQPCPTIIKSPGKLLMPDSNHYLGIDQLKRAGGFPDQCQFAGAYEAVSQRIGNSVPPLFMRAIARHIRRELLT